MATSKKAGLVLIVFCACVAGCSTARMHPEFAQRRAAIKSVAVIPPSVEVLLVTFTGDNQPLYDVAARVRREVAPLVEQEMRDRGFSITKARLEEGDLAEEPEMRFEVTQMLASFQRRTEEIFRAEKKEFRYSLGQEVSYLGQRADAHSLVFVTVKGFQKSSGEMAKDRVVGFLTQGVVGAVMTPSGGAQIQAALVDASTGEVLWYDARQSPSDPGDSGELAGLVKNVFSGFSTK